MPNRLVNSMKLTEGSIWKGMLVFSIPLVLTNLLQQLYNTADTLIVGNLIGANALAAVGAGTVIIFLLIGFVNGITVGAGVVIAQFYGSGDIRLLKRAVATSIIFTAILGTVLTVVGVVFCGDILRLIGTPQEVFDDAKIYLVIYFGGGIFMALYNMGASALRAVGDSKTPLIYLATATLVNIVLDIVFVAVFGMGVEGVAIATFFAQGVCAYMVMRKMFLTREVYRINLRTLRVSPLILVRVLRIGIPTSLQQTLMSISNLVVQSTINSFGTVVMGAWNVYGKIEGLLILPILSFGLAITTFTGQNVGAGQRERVYEGAKIGVIMSCGFSVSVTILVLIFGKTLLSIFTNSPELLAHGWRMIVGMTPFYFLVALMYSLSGVINGAGYSFYTMMIMLGALCVVRILFLKLMTPFISGMAVVYYAYITSWSLCCAGLYIYYRRGSWRKVFETPVTANIDNA